MRMAAVRDRLSPRLLLRIAPLAVIVLVPFALFGPPLPGPNVREWLGLANPPELSACTPRQSAVLSPAMPPPPPGEWRPEPPSPLARTEMAGTAVGGVAFTTAGQPPSRVVLTFDPRTGRYRRETRLPVAVDHSLVVAHGDAVYVIGGFLAPREGEVAGEPTNRAWRYDLSQRRWRELPSMARARGGLTGGVIGGRIYAVAGGPNPFPEDQPPTRTVEVFDIASERWSSAAPIPTPRHHAGAAALDGRLYVAGGRRTGDYTMSSVERFDPRANRWERLAPLPLGVGDLRVVAAGGRVIALGGDDEIGAQDGGGYVTPAVWAYDPSEERWVRLPDMSQPRHGFAAAVIEDRVYVFEGSPCPGHGFSRTAESLRVQPGSFR
ncbi:MAG TPA: kelch repeat-containing protein [Thermoleophilaceae bacterium]|nr:kelch repeat-containing protein [Thermoleophilaceae bacterium]